MALTPVSNDSVSVIQGAVQEIQAAVQDLGFLSDKIVILDPSTGDRTPYDPTTDTGGTRASSVAVGPRDAYVKAEGVDIVTRNGATYNITKYRVQFLPEADDPIFREGMIVRVLAGGNNAKLVNYPLDVSGEVNGSIVALVKLECVSNGVPTDPYVVS